MLYTYKLEQQILPVNAPIAFNQNEVLTGCTVTHEVGSVNIKLNKPGVYMVQFNGAITATTTGASFLQLFRNGVAVPGAATGTIVTSGTVVNPSFMALVTVKPNCCQIDNVPANLQVVSTGAATTVNLASLTVTKVG